MGKVPLYETTQFQQNAEKTYAVARKLGRFHADTCSAGGKGGAPSMLSLDLTCRTTDSTCSFTPTIALCCHFVSIPYVGTGPNLTPDRSEAGPRALL